MKTEFWLRIGSQEYVVKMTDNITKQVTWWSMIIDHDDQDDDDDNDQNGPGGDDAQSYDVNDHYCDNSC